MGDGSVKIGSHSNGFFDVANSIVTKNKLGEDTSFDKAKQTAENRKVDTPKDVNNGTINHEWDSGAEVIVGQKGSDGSYKYDTYQTVINSTSFGKSDSKKRVSDVEHVKLFVDAVEELQGVEGFVVDEKNNIRIIGDPKSQDIISMILDHTKSREFQAVFMLIDKLDNPQNKQVLTELANKLKTLQNGVEQKEGQLTNEISTQSKNLAKMEVPFKQRITNAQNDIPIKTQELSKANFNVKETNRPGASLIESKINEIASKLNSQRSNLNNLERVQTGDSYTSRIINKVNDINTRENENYILWMKMNDPQATNYDVSNSWDNYVDNRSKITELKKEILLETSKQKRQEDVANEILPGVRNTVENTEALLETVKNINNNGRNQGPVVDEPNELVNRAKSDLEFAKKQMDIVENKQVGTQNRINQLRTKIENNENKVAKMFVLQQEISDLQFQLQNMDKYSRFSNQWNKDTVRNELSEKMYALSSLQYEVGMIKSRPSQEYFSNIVTSQHSNPFDSKPSSGTASNQHSNAFDSKPSSNNASSQHSNAFDSKPSSGTASSQHSNAFDSKPSNNNVSSQHSNPFDKVSSSYYVKTFDNENFSSFDMESKTDLKSLQSMWNNSWNTVVKYSQNRDEFTLDQARDELRSNDNSLMRAQASFQNKVENILTNLPNSTEEAKRDAGIDKDFAEKKLSDSNNELKAAQTSFSNDPNLVAKRNEISNLKGDLSNTSGIFKKMTEEAKSKLK